MKTIQSAFLILCVAILAACNGGKGNHIPADEGAKMENLYAKGFEIAVYDGYKTVQIANPWDTAKVLHKYILVEKGAPLPDNLPKGTIVRTPVENAIMYTTIHVAIWENLGALDAIAGICEPEYLTSQKVKALVTGGKIADCGKAASPNVEKIMDIDARIIIATPFENGGYGQAEKLGIPIFECADYMENHPLGRVEWMKVFGLLSGKEELADSLFNATVQRYNDLCKLAGDAPGRPKLISERKYGSTWFTAGGASYMAVMYRDAGADYVLADNKETGSVPFSFEAMYEKGYDSDVWIFLHDNPYLNTYNDLRQEYTPYENFAPFRNRNIYVCNTVQAPYYEYIAIHPDYILADFVKIFHPHLMPDYKLQCFKPLGD